MFFQAEKWGNPYPNNHASRSRFASLQMTGKPACCRLESEHHPSNCVGLQSPTRRVTAMNHVDSGLRSVDVQFNDVYWPLMFDTVSLALRPTCTTSTSGIGLTQRQKMLWHTHTHNWIHSLQHVLQAQFLSITFCHKFQRNVKLLQGTMHDGSPQHGLPRWLAQSIWNVTCVEANECCMKQVW